MSWSFLTKTFQLTILNIQSAKVLYQLLHNVFRNEIVIEYSVPMNDIPADEDNRAKQSLADCERREKGKQDPCLNPLTVRGRLLFHF